MKRNNFQKTLISLLSCSYFISTPLPAEAKVKIYTFCQMGECFDTYFLSKEVIQKKQQGTLYLVKLESYHYLFESSPSNSQKSHSEIYIFCSTQKPAHIILNWEGSGKAFIAFLNPGGGMIGAASAPAYSEYWATCHNFIDTYLKDLTDKAIQLGYPLNLEESQIESDEPFQLLN